MAAQHRSLREFNPADDSISSYLKCASLYFTANEVAGVKQVVVLLSSIDPTIYALLSDLFEPEKPSSKNLKQISEALVNHSSLSGSSLLKCSTFIRGTRLQES